MDTRKLFLETIELFPAKLLSDNEIEKEIEIVIHKRERINFFYKCEKEDILTFLKRNPSIFKAIHYSSNLDLFLKLKIVGVMFDFLDYQPKTFFEFVSSIIFSLRGAFILNSKKLDSITFLDKKWASLLCQDLTAHLDAFCYQTLKYQLGLNHHISAETQIQVCQFLPKSYLSETIIQDFFIANHIAENMDIPDNEAWHLLEENINNPRFEFIFYLLADMLSYKQFLIFFDLLIAKLPRNIESLKFLLHTWTESRFSDLNLQQYEFIINFGKDMLKNVEHQKTWKENFMYFNALIQNRHSYEKNHEVHYILLHLFEGQLTPIDKRLFDASKYQNNFMFNKALEDGANVNGQDANGQTPLHILANSKNYKLIIKLLENGADPSIKDHDGKIPINYATDDYTKELFTTSSLRKTSAHINNNLFPPVIKAAAPAQSPQMSNFHGMRLSSNEE